MGKARVATFFWGTFALVLLLPFFYEGAYYLLVERVTVYGRAPLPNLLRDAPGYRRLGEETGAPGGPAARFFGWAHAIDHQVRPKFWAKCEDGEQ
jgi:hypothetical protein